MSPWLYVWKWVSAICVLEIGGPPRAQRITADAVREMQLRKGQTAAALMKSTEVMITRV